MRHSPLSARWRVAADLSEAIFYRITVYVSVALLDWPTLIYCETLPGLIEIARGGDVIPGRSPFWLLTGNFFLTSPGKLELQSVCGSFWPSCSGRRPLATVPTQFLC